MALRYKIDVLAALRERGYSSFRLRSEKIIGESYLTQLRNGKMISHACLDKLCELLKCQPGDILEYVEEDG